MTERVDGDIEAWIELAGILEQSDLQVGRERERETYLSNKILLASVSNSIMISPTHKGLCI